MVTSSSTTSTLAMVVFRGKSAARATSENFPGELHLCRASRDLICVCAIPRAVYVAEIYETNWNGCLERRLKGRQGHSFDSERRPQGHGVLLHCAVREWDGHEPGGTDCRCTCGM